MYTFSFCRSISYAYRVYDYLQAMMVTMQVNRKKPDASLCSILITTLITIVELKKKKKRNEREDFIVLVVGIDVYME